VAVGDDYKKMMEETKQKSLKGPLGSQIVKMAEH